MDKYADELLGKFIRSIGFVYGNRIFNQSTSQSTKVVLTPMSHQDESSDMQRCTVSTSLTLTLGQICTDLWPDLKMIF